MTDKRKPSFLTSDKLVNVYIRNMGPPLVSRGGGFEVFDLLIISLFSDFELDYFQVC